MSSYRNFEIQKTTSLNTFAMKRVLIFLSIQFCLVPLLCVTFKVRSSGRGPVLESGCENHSKGAISLPVGFYKGLYALKFSNNTAFFVIMITIKCFL